MYYFSEESSLDGKLEEISKRDVVTPQVSSFSTIAERAESSRTLIVPDSSRMLNNLAEKSPSVDRLICPICKKCYKSMDTFRVHCKQKHKILDNICLSCETKCYKFPLLIQHINRHHATAIH